MSERVQTIHSSEAISRRQHIMGILAAAFLAGVLLFRFTLPPKLWRRADASMTREELRAKLGKPDIENGNQIHWREKRLLGDWVLTAHFNDESVKTLQNHFQFFNKAAK